MRSRVHSRIPFRFQNSLFRTLSRSQLIKLFNYCEETGRLISSTSLLRLCTFLFKVAKLFANIRNYQTRKKAPRAGQVAIKIRNVMNFYAFALLSFTSRSIRFWGTKSSIVAEKLLWRKIFSRAPDLAPFRKHFHDKYPLSKQSSLLSAQLVRLLTTSLNFIR